MSGEQEQPKEEAPPKGLWNRVKRAVHAAVSYLPKGIMYAAAIGGAAKLIQYKTGWDPLGTGQGIAGFGKFVALSVSVGAGLNVAGSLITDYVKDKQPETPQPQAKGEQAGASTVKARHQEREQEIFQGVQNNLPRGKAMGQNVPTIT